MQLYQNTYYIIYLIFTLKLYNVLSELKSFIAL